MRTSLALALISTFVATILAVPAAEKRAGTLAGTIYTQCTEPNTIALTFDDGPFDYQASIVKQLNAAGAKATFFVTGIAKNCIYKQAAVLKATFDAGHQIGSHTWSHSSPASMSVAQLTLEMTKLETALANILNVKPRYMRPPNGNTGGNVRSVMKTLGYRIIKWDISAADYSVSPTRSEATFTAAPPGLHIALMHEVIKTTDSTLLPWVLKWAKQKGYKMVTVAECLGDKGGAYTTPVAKTSARTC